MLYSSSSASCGTTPTPLDRQFADTAKAPPPAAMARGGASSFSQSYRGGNFASQAPAAHREGQGGPEDDADDRAYPAPAHGVSARPALLSRGSASGVTRARARIVATVDTTSEATVRTPATTC